MRKIIYAINLTADGCCDHTKGIPNEDVHRYFAQLIREADVLVYGRITYELMVPFWPDIAKSNSGQTETMNAFAQAFAAVKKIVVFSKSLAKAGGENTTIFRDNLEQELLKLKQEDGKDILLGGIDLASQVIALGLVDEFHFMIQPTIAGAGRRLMEGTSLPENLSLKLIDTKVLPAGFVVLRYGR